MKRFSRRGLGGLIAVNAALLAVLAFVTFATTTNAQGFRSRGDYVAVSGTVPGWEAGIIYIVDQRNQQLVAMTYDPNTKTLLGVGARNLAADLSLAQGN